MLDSSSSSSGGTGSAHAGFAEGDVVFNIVWTGRSFEHLQIFFLSLMHQSGARFRFVANACPPDQVAAMERMAERLPDRVVGVVEVSPHVMLSHGASLDKVLAAHDDGELFCFIDADILASGPYLPEFLEVLGRHEAVTSGRELWSTSNVRPAEHLGVNGEFFFDQDGFVFGSPHMALYHRSAVLETAERWGIGFGSAGQDMSDDVRRRLADLGRGYWIFDTAKVMNILLQGDGFSLVHLEHPELQHIGGVSHFLAPPRPVTEDGRPRPARWGETPDWGGWKGMAARYSVAQHTAGVLLACAAGEPLPPLPEDLDPSILGRLERVRVAMEELVSRHSSDMETVGGLR